MNKTHLPHLVFFFLIFGMVSFSPLQAQVCNGDAPIDYLVIPNPSDPSECFLQINWGDAMPEILCGNPGTPALGSTIAEDQRIEFLYATIGGVEYTLYSRLDCPGLLTTLEYGAEANTYITALSSVDFCLADVAHFIRLEGIVLGADDFDCLLPNAQGALPVELLYFKASVEGKFNVLEWATSSEDNVASFVVERSTDGRRNAEIVGATAAVGFSNSLENYQLEDRNPRPLTYYRLRSIDFDGSESTSEWIAVQRKTSTKDKFVEISPVPLGQEPLQVYYQADTDEKVIITISDINGKVLYERNLKLEAGVYNWSIELPQNEKGLLILRVHNKEGIHSQLIPRLSEN